MDFLNNYFLRPMGWGWATPDEVALQNIPLQNTQKRKIDERDRADAIAVEPASNNVRNILFEPSFKRQKNTHNPEKKQPESTKNNELFSGSFVDESALEKEIIANKSKVLPVQLQQPQNLKELNQALLILETYHSQGLIDLDMGDRSLNCLLTPLLSKKYNEKDAWLSDFFIISFLKEKIKHSTKSDILIYDCYPDNPTLASNMMRVAKKNKNATKVIWPICEKQHFYLIMIDYHLAKNIVYIYALDGFNSKNQQKLYLKKANDFAEMLYPKAECYMKIPQKIIHQDNIMDCGVVVCYYASHFIKKTSLEFQAWAYCFSFPKPLSDYQALQPYTPYRKKIAESIFSASNRILPEVTEPQKKIVIDKF